MKLTQPSNLMTAFSQKRAFIGISRLTPASTIDEAVFAMVQREI